MHNKFIHTGKCIWCNRSFPDVSFLDAPHIVPRSIGGTELGIDVCDECNHFFGTAGKGSPLNTNTVFKEVFNASLHSLRDNVRLKSKYGSAYFHYNKKLGVIKLKSNLPVIAFTKQFKRSLYEVFLQKYHKTYPDEPLDKFEAVRKFARYGEGNLHVYFVYNKIVLHPQDEKEDIVVRMNDVLKKDIENYGYFQFFFCGHILYLEVLPLTASIVGINGLYKLAEKMILPVDDECGLYELNDIRSFDMFYTRLANKQFITDYRLRR